ncbi:predicted protein [Uncinocarpus reesii 1704]|uniref:Uncharacterized protein n=1 Tax=Uncinocarpus reesii (strain UAMH 1704) TaxID=336963 RepID=C4JW13_UNCRE|nr:uncharacterized protein UREG_06755 [Uncinocarpus reesii 1704]EEP81890.1 predicted protein [Uncinocarpus reesii 1704]
MGRHNEFFVINKLGFDWYARVYNFCNFHRDVNSKGASSLIYNRLKPIQRNEGSLGSMIKFQTGFDAEIRPYESI